MARWTDAHPWNQRTRVELAEGAARKKLREGELAEDVREAAPRQRRARDGARYLGDGCYRHGHLPRMEDSDDE